MGGLVIPCCIQTVDIPDKALGKNTKKPKYVTCGKPAVTFVKLPEELPVFMTQAFAYCMEHSVGPRARNAIPISRAEYVVIKVMES